MRGFASLFFLLALSNVLLAQMALDTSARNAHSTAHDVLPERRLEIENGIDVIIREELHTGLVLEEPHTRIQDRINGKIVEYLEEFPSQHAEPISYTFGIASLDQTHYLSLLHGELTPLSREQLRLRSHVLVLPIDETNRYGEYSYTGGTLGTGILVGRIHAGDTNTLFALPSGYRACATTLTGRVPCVVSGASGK